MEKQIALITGGFLKEKAPKEIISKAYHSIGEGEAVEVLYGHPSGRLYEVKGMHYAYNYLINQTVAEKDLYFTGLTVD